MKKTRNRNEKLAAIERESERALRERIQRWQALTPSRRTNFLRKELAPGRSAS